MMENFVLPRNIRLRKLAIDKPDLPMTMKMASI